MQSMPEKTVSTKDIYTGKVITVKVSTVEIKDQKITGDYATPDCSSEQKKIRVSERYDLSSYRHVYAYGNSHEDLDMLSLADTPYMVGEDQSLPLLQAVKKLA